MGFTLLFGILGTLSILIAKRSLLNGPALFWLIWFVTGLILFSFSNRAPAHYIESFAPAIAVMGGLGIARGAGYFGAIRIVVIPLTILLLMIYGLWITEEYPLLRTRLLYALAIGIVLYLCIYVSRFFTSSRFTIPILAIFLFFPLLTSMWIISFTPRAQITVPNPVLFAGENFNSRSNSDGQSWRRVPAEKFISQLPANSTSQYKFGIDGINNAGEAIAFTGQPILPVWNQYRREIMLPPDAIAKLLEDGDLPYLMLSEGRIATGLLEDLMAVAQEYCGYDQKLSRGFKGWVILKCDK
jgi:4-amino-4-deoxy-L-arabinose transferase-like glycosyltransferase